MGDLSTRESNVIPAQILPVSPNTKNGEDKNN